MSAVLNHLPLLAHSLQQERGALTAGLPRLLTVADESPTLATGAEVADEPTLKRPKERDRRVFLFLFIFKNVKVQRCCVLSHDRQQRSL